MNRFFVDGQGWPAHSAEEFGEFDAGDEPVGLDEPDEFIRFDEVEEVAGLGAARAQVVPLRPAGASGLEDVAVTAGRGSRMAEELAVLVDQMADTIRLQDRVLAGVAAATVEAGERVATARRVAARVASTLGLVCDQLGAQHVQLCELAEQLDVQLPGAPNADPTNSAVALDMMRAARWAA